MLKPRLVILAGANGCGKTTLKKTILAHQWTEGCEFINPDDIAKEVYGGYNEAAFLKAQKYSTDLTYQYLAQGKSMVLETAFSSERKLHLVEAAKLSGFFIRLYFIGTDSPIINSGRVCRRMLEGGHEVYIRDIIKRHTGAERMCISASTFVDRLYVFDNSIDDKNPTELFRVRDQYLGKVNKEVLDHNWSTELLRNIVDVLSKYQEKL